jgi:hypothetical protein
LKRKCWTSYADIHICCALPIQVSPDGQLKAQVALPLRPMAWAPPKKGMDMESNVYAPPKARLVDEGGEAPNHYVVSKKKFWILFLSTLGIYHLYWFYVNWSLHKSRTGERMLPFMRALFSIFFAHSLFRLIDSKLRERNLGYVWSPGSLATMYVICTVVGHVCDRLARKSIGSPVTDFSSLLLLPLVGFALYKAQDAINVACDEPNGESNGDLSWANWVWIVLGAILWLLIAIGLYYMLLGSAS